MSIISFVSGRSQSPNALPKQKNVRRQRVRTNVKRLGVSGRRVNARQNLNKNSVIGFMNAWFMITRV